MDVNMSAEVKGYGMPAPPAIERDNRAKAETRPVEPGKGAGRPVQDEQQLQARDEAQRRQGQTGNGLEQAAEEIQQRLDKMGTQLQFSVDDKTESIVIQITDRKSGEVVRQIPAEEMLELKSKLEKLLGLLIDKKV